MKQFFYFALLATILIFGGCEKAKKENPVKKSDNTTQTKAKEKLPKSENSVMTEEITLHGVNGEKVTFIKKGNNVKLKDNDKAILLDFFATWCPPCKAEIPHLTNLQNRYKKDLKIISILLEDGKPDNEIENFIKFNNINYTITNGGSNFTFSNMLGGVSKIPFMILYDKNGEKVTSYLGAVPEEMIESDIKKAIGK